MLAYHDKLVHSYTKPHYHHKSQTKKNRAWSKKKTLTKNTSTHVYEITYIHSCLIHFHHKKNKRQYIYIYVSSTCGATREHVGQDVVRGGDHILQPSSDNFGHRKKNQDSKKKTTENSGVFWLRRKNNIPNFERHFEGHKKKHHPPTSQMNLKWTCRRQRWHRHGGSYDANIGKSSSQKKVIYKPFNVRYRLQELYFWWEKFAN